MRRDERTFDPSEGEGELEAIAAQWTKKWKELGGPSREISRIRRREEFKVLEPYVMQLKPGARLLDGGCGMGQWTVFFTRLGYPTVGLDVSQPTIEQLTKLFPECEFQVADIRDSGLAKEMFDIYFSWGTFEHFEEGFDPVVGEAYRLLRPGGRLLISTPFDNVRHATTAAFAKPKLAKRSKPRTRFYQWRINRVEMSQILERAGFEVEAVHIIGKRQGIVRMLHHSLGIPHSWRSTHAVAEALSWLVPGVLIGHMILAVARKPD